MFDLYLVTGAAGHLGSAIVRQLLSLGKKVRALILPNEKNIPEGDIEICYGDVCDKQSLNSFFENSDGDNLIVIHCAGIVSISSQYIQKVYDVNVNGTKNIVDICEEKKVGKLVHVSSVHAIPEKPKNESISEVSEFNPNDVYGLYAKTKSEATAYVLAAAKRGLNASVVHPSGICGPYDNGISHITALVLAYCSGKLKVAADGGYDFVDVRDVANGIILCTEKGKRGECYILSNGYYSMKDILNMLQKITGIKKIKTILPTWFVKLTAPLAELYYKISKKTPLFTKYSIYTINSNAAFSHSKASAELGYNTRDMYQTLTDSVLWLKKTCRI